jgi:lipopolysaccharide biosynthesis regulator YciM
MSEQQPGHAAAQALEQARGEIGNGNNTAAVTLVRQAVGRADCSPDQLAEAARLGVNLGLEESFGWFMRAGRRQLEDGNIEGARSTFEAARSVDEKNYEPIFELGRVEIASGNKAAGLGRFAEVLRKSNYTFVPALFEAGCVYEDDDQIDQAILTFKRIVERDKSHAHALAHLGRLYRMKQMAPEATAYLMQAADSARKVMDYGLALQCARDILEFDPGNARARGLESELEKIAPAPRDKDRAAASREPAKPAPPSVQQVAATIMPPDFKLIEQQSKATLELAQVTAAVAEAYKSRLAIEEQIRAAQATLESVTQARTGADQELGAIKAQLDNVAKARAAEEASLAALHAKLEHTRQGLTAVDTLQQAVKQADEQRGGVHKSIEQVRAEAAGVKQTAQKAKTDAIAVEKALTEVAASFGALRKEAEAAKAGLDGAKSQAEKAKVDAMAAEAVVAQARTKLEAAQAQADAAHKKITEAAAHADAVASDASASLSGIADIESTIGATASAQKNVADAIAQLHALAVALTERRKQTETALAQIPGLDEPQAAGLTDADIAKLEAGLAAAIEKASRPAPQPGPQPAPQPAAAAAAPTPGAAPAATAGAGKNNGAGAAVPPAKAKGETAKPEPAKAEPVKAGAAKAEPAKAESAKAETPKAEPAKAEAPKSEAAAPKADDSSPKGVFARGLAALDANKPQDAMKLFESIQSNPEYAVLAQTAIGRCYAQLGQAEEAVQRYSKALETPGHPEEQYHEALYFMSAAHESRDDDESRELAIWALEEVAAANPNYRDVATRIEALKTKAAKAATSGSA